MTHERFRDYTRAELFAMKDEVQRARVKEERACAWCDRVILMKPEQRFCCPSCRVAYSQAAARIQYERLLMEKAAWEVERGELLKEISELKRRVPTGS